jgi:hypothetical protein
MSRAKTVAVLLVVSLFILLPLYEPRTSASSGRTTATLSR